MTKAERAALTAAFRERFRTAPQGFARAPGRVNIIGEHLDYNGFSVLPIAIDREVRAAFRRREDRRLVLESLDPSADGPREFLLEAPLDPFPAGDWGNYAKAAAFGLFGVGGAYREPPGRGADVLIDSDLPQAAGLSSSSALVVLTALILLELREASMDRLALAALLADAERYVGTRGGGMDQAACLCGRDGHALRIAFDPLAVDPIPVPARWRFVVADSGVRAAKSAAAHYNNRADECRLAAATLAEGTDTLADVPAERLREPELSRRLSRLDETHSATLARRVRHVRTEAERVEAACRALRAADAAGMGRLMNDSHASCRDLFEISCPELDALVEAALSHGALGSRLTGAGFGGCTVSLVTEDGAEALAAALPRAFVVRPAAGARVEVAE